MTGLVRWAAVAPLLGACIANNKDGSDSLGRDTLTDVTLVEVGGDQCQIDEDCPPATNACERPHCQGTCRLVAVTCDDGNDCTDDRCDATTGCISTPTPPGTQCLVGAGSESCEGEIYHLVDQCDGEGRCHDNGSENCADELGGPCYRSACIITDIGGGCELVPRSDRQPCSADGFTNECIDGAIYGADVCIDGECVDGGSVLCPSAFCERSVCTAEGGCAVRSIGVERQLTGIWRMLELFQAGTPDAPRLGTIDSAIAFKDDGRVTTFGSYTSVPQLAAPGDGDYCVSDDGELRFALPYGAVAPAPRKQYRGIFTMGDDFALVFRDGEASLGVLVRLPEGNAPKLDGRYRVVGVFRRNVIGPRAVLGEIVFDANGCITGGGVRFSDEFETTPILEGECVGIFGWLIGLRLTFGTKEEYVFRGTAIHGGDVAVLTINTDQTSVGDGLLILSREQSIEDVILDGRHTFARLDVHDEVTSAARGEAVLETSDYQRYVETSLDGTSVTTLLVGGVSLSSVFDGGVREESGEGPGTRVRLGQSGGNALGRVGFLIDVAVPHLTVDQESAAPEGTSLRIAIVRP